MAGAGLIVGEVDRDLDARREITKWLALVAMVLDHTGKTLLPFLMLPMHFAGRLALPLFALVIAERLARRAALRGKYLRRLAFWGVVAQPGYAMVASEPAGNILFTLGLGVALDLCLRDFGGASGARRAALLLVAALSLGLATQCDYGVPGVLLVPVLAALERWRPLTASWASGPLALAVNVIGSAAPVFVHLAALAASPMAAWLRETPVPLPRPHRYFFHAFYAGHLYLLAALARLVSLDG
jgi:hypothetical protein